MENILGKIKDVVTIVRDNLKLKDSTRTIYPFVYQLYSDQKTGTATVLEPLPIPDKLDSPTMQRMRKLFGEDEVKEVVDKLPTLPFERGYVLGCIYQYQRQTNTVIIHVSTDGKITVC